MGLPEWFALPWDGKGCPVGGAGKALRDAHVQAGIVQMGTLSQDRGGVLARVPTLLALYQVPSGDCAFVRRVGTSLGTTDAFETLKKTLNPALTQRYEGISKKGLGFSYPANKSLAILLVL